MNYSFFFWLPYYLHMQFNWTDSESNAVSSWFDVGGIIGGIVGGLVSDFSPFRSPIVFGMLVCGIPSLIGFYHSPPTKSGASGLMVLLGFFIGGASNIISAACAADLGKEALQRGMHSAIALVTGIIDGTGSVGAALGQILIPIMEQGTGWASVFYLFMAMAALAALAVLPSLVRELKRFFAQIYSSITF